MRVSLPSHGSSSSSPAGSGCTHTGNGDAPLSGEGILLEIVQAPPEVIAAFDNAKPPVTPGSAS